VFSLTAVLESINGVRMGNTKKNAKAKSGAKKPEPATAHDASIAAALLPSVTAGPKGPSTRWIELLGAAAAQQAVASVLHQLATRKGLKGLGKAMTDAKDVFDLVAVHARLLASEQAVRQRIVAVETRLGPVVTSLNHAVQGEGDDSPIVAKLGGILSLREKTMTVSKGKRTKTKNKKKSANKPG
jgi:hypothetical protein